MHVPPVEKQFLISPPCSPPVGWEQPREGQPVVDYELIAAMAQLAPGKQRHRRQLFIALVNSLSHHQRGKRNMKWSGDDASERERARMKPSGKL